MVVHLPASDAWPKPIDGEANKKVALTADYLLENLNGQALPGARFEVYRCVPSGSAPVFSGTAERLSPHCIGPWETAARAGTVVAPFSQLIRVAALSDAGVTMRTQIELSAGQTRWATTIALAEDELTCRGCLSPDAPYGVLFLPRSYDQETGCFTSPAFAVLPCAKDNIQCMIRRFSDVTTLSSDQATAMTDELNRANDNMKKAQGEARGADKTLRQAFTARRRCIRGRAIRVAGPDSRRPGASGSGAAPPCVAGIPRGARSGRYKESGAVRPARRCRTLRRRATPARHSNKHRCRGTAEGSCRGRTPGRLRTRQQPPNRRRLDKHR